MNDAISGGGSALVERAKAIILKPKEEWPAIAGETTSPGDILTRYAIPLAAIGPIASLVGGQLFGYGALGFSYRPGLIAGLGTAVVGVVFALIGLVVLTFIADFLAPRFGGEANRTNAFKLVAYSMTASWVAGIFGLIPSLGILGLVGLYSLYLYYLGVGTVMKVPQDKAAGFTVVSVIAAVVVGLVLGAVTAPVVGLFAGSALSSSGDVSGKVTLPGGGTIDLDKAQDATKQLEAAANGKDTDRPRQAQGAAPHLDRRLAAYCGGIDRRRRSRQPSRGHLYLGRQKLPPQDRRHGGAGRAGRARQRDGRDLGSRGRRRL